MNEIRLRLKALRLEMLKQNLDAFYISGTDPHSSEYLPGRWQARAFISGFTGSYGLVVVTQEEAGLWTDSRYFLQAEEQLKGSGIKMFKLRVPGAVLPENWLAKKLTFNSKVGIDPQSVTVSGFRNLENTLVKKGIHLLKTNDLFDKIWEDRPEIPANPVFELETKYAGATRKEKREAITAGLKKEGADLHVITTLDELAWTFNLRGSDVAFNPVFTGFGIIGKSESVLFIQNNKISLDLKLRFEKERITVKEYVEFYGWLTAQKSRSFFLDPDTTNYAVYEALNDGNVIVEGTSQVALLKACKNTTELEGFKTAMKKDGAALVNFLFWLKNSLGKEEITEFTVGKKLAEFRAKQADFMGESFSPIVGYKNHGAIVHLSVDRENALPLKKEGMLLFDSGGHYLQGTTDITRTVALGKVTDRQKTDYTLVLKGMIALTTVKFPVGTKGAHLDILARKALWENGLNYGHGTGHGVGHFLNVHEGPISIRQEFNFVPLEPGMVMSNEPALYREGEYGIRTENMLCCVEKEETAFAKFLGFETLTLCPIDTSLLDEALITTEEKNWLNDYHKKVNAELKPLLGTEFHHFIDELTKPV